MPKQFLVATFLDEGSLERAVHPARKERFRVHDVYAPYPVHIFPDSMNQSGGGIKFRDLQGLAKYPVDSSQLDTAQVILKSYRPAAHFTRRLVIPDIRLNDWKIDATIDNAAGRR